MASTKSQKVLLALKKLKELEEYLRTFTETPENQLSEEELKKILKRTFNISQFVDMLSMRALLQIYHLICRGTGTIPVESICISAHFVKMSENDATQFKKELMNVIFELLGSVKGQKTFPENKCSEYYLSLLPDVTIIEIAEKFQYLLDCRSDAKDLHGYVKDLLVRDFNEEPWVRGVLIKFIVVFETL